MYLLSIPTWLIGYNQIENYIQCVIHIESLEINSQYFQSAQVECTAFTVDDSTQGSWTATPIGTTVTIECPSTHSLVGSATLTCKQDGSWSDTVPQCDAKIGKCIF